jgi:hypothetical protein
MNIWDKTSALISKIWQMHATLHNPNTEVHNTKSVHLDVRDLLGPKNLSQTWKSNV